MSRMTMESRAALFRDVLPKFEGTLLDPTTNSRLLNNIPIVLGSIGAGLGSESANFLKWVFKQWRMGPVSLHGLAAMSLYEYLSDNEYLPVISTIPVVITNLKWLIDSTQQYDVILPATLIFRHIGQKYASYLAPYYAELIDLLVRWSLDPNLPSMAAQHISNLFRNELRSYWTSNTAHGLISALQFQRDMEQILTHEIVDTRKIVAYVRSAVSIAVGSTKSGSIPSSFCACLTSLWTLAAPYITNDELTMSEMTNIVIDFVPYLATSDSTAEHSSCLWAVTSYVIVGVDFDLKLMNTLLFILDAMAHDVEHHHSTLVQITNALLSHVGTEAIRRIGEFAPNILASCILDLYRSPGDEMINRFVLLLDIVKRGDVILGQRCVEILMDAPSDAVSMLLVKIIRSVHLDNPWNVLMHLFDRYYDNIDTMIGIEMLSLTCDWIAEVSSEGLRPDLVTFEKFVVQLMEVLQSDARSLCKPMLNSLARMMVEEKLPHCGRLFSTLVAIHTSFDEPELLHPLAVLAMPVSLGISPHLSPHLSPRRCETTISPSHLHWFLSLISSDSLPQCDPPVPPQLTFERLCILSGLSPEAQTKGSTPISTPIDTSNVAPHLLSLCVSAAITCIHQRLRTPWGGPVETFTALEHVIERIDVGDVDRANAFLLFFEHLERHLYSAYEGTVTGIQYSPATVQFFKSNRKVCEEWLMRLRVPMTRLSSNVHADVSLMLHSTTLVRKAVGVWRQLRSTMIQTGTSIDERQATLRQDLCSLVIGCATALCRMQEHEVLAGLSLFLKRTLGEDTDVDWDVLHTLLGDLSDLAEGRYESAVTSLLQLMQSAHEQVAAFDTSKSLLLNSAILDAVIRHTTWALVALRDWPDLTVHIDTVASMYKALHKQYQDMRAQRLRSLLTSCHDYMDNQMLAAVFQIGQNHTKLGVASLARSPRPDVPSTGPAVYSQSRVAHYHLLEAQLSLSSNDWGSMRSSLEASNSAWCGVPCGIGVGVSNIKDDALRHVAACGALKGAVDASSSMFLDENMGVSTYVLKLIDAMDVQVLPVASTLPSWLSMMDLVERMWNECQGDESGDLTILTTRLFIAKLARSGGNYGIANQMLDGVLSVASSMASPQWITLDHTAKLEHAAWLRGLARYGEAADVLMALLDDGEACLSLAKLLSCSDWPIEERFEWLPSKLSLHGTAKDLPILPSVAVTSFSWLDGLGMDRAKEEHQKEELNEACGLLFRDAVRACSNRMDVHMAYGNWVLRMARDLQKKGAVNVPVTGNVDDRLIGIVSNVTFPPSDIVALVKQALPDCTQEALDQAVAMHLQCRQKAMVSHISAAESLSQALKCGGESMQEMSCQLELLDILCTVAGEYHDRACEAILTTTSKWTRVMPQVMAIAKNNTDVAVQHIIGQLLSQEVERDPMTMVWQVLSLSSDSPSIIAARTALAKTSPSLYQQTLLIITELKKLAELPEERWSYLLRRANQQLSVQQSSYSHAVGPILDDLESELDVFKSSAHVTSRDKWFNLRVVPHIVDAFHSVRKCKGDVSTALAPLNRVRKQLERFIRRHANQSIDIHSIAPVLAKLRDCAVSVPGTGVTIQQFDQEIMIIGTKTCPKRVTVRGSDGEKHRLLLKAHEDMRLDERVMQFISVASQAVGDISAPTYHIQPIGSSCGLVQWLDGARTVYTVYRAWQERQGTAQRPSDLYWEKLRSRADESGVELSAPRDTWPLDLQRRVWRDLVSETPPDLVARELWRTSAIAKDWWSKSKLFAQTSAVLSAVGYILGIGDRHMDNMLLFFDTGKLVHVDFSVCFDHGKSLKVPETVPFRLTPNLDRAMGLGGADGPFRTSLERTLGALRDSSDTMSLLLDVFVNDPVIDSSTMPSAEITGHVLSTRATALSAAYSEWCAAMTKLWPSYSDAVNGAVSEYEKLWSMKEMMQNRGKLLAEAEAELNDAMTSLSDVDVQIREVNARRQQASNDRHVVLRLIDEAMRECTAWQARFSRTVNDVRGDILSKFKADIDTVERGATIDDLAHEVKIHGYDEHKAKIASVLGLIKTCIGHLNEYRNALVKTSSDYVHSTAPGGWITWLQRARNGQHVLEGVTSSRSAERDADLYEEYASMAAEITQVEGDKARSATQAATNGAEIDKCIACAKKGIDDWLALCEDKATRIAPGFKARTTKQKAPSELAFMLDATLPMVQVSSQHKTRVCAQYAVSEVIWKCAKDIEECGDIEAVNSVMGVATGALLLCRSGGVLPHTWKNEPPFHDGNSIASWLDVDKMRTSMERVLLPPYKSLLQAGWAALCSIRRARQGLVSLWGSDISVEKDAQAVLASVKKLRETAQAMAVVGTTDTPIMWRDFREIVTSVFASWVESGGDPRGSPPLLVKVDKIVACVYDATSSIVVHKGDGRGSVDALIGVLDSVTAVFNHALGVECSVPCDWLDDLHAKLVMPALSTGLRRLVSMWAKEYGLDASEIMSGSAPIRHDATAWQETLLDIGSNRSTVLKLLAKVKVFDAEFKALDATIAAMRAPCEVFAWANEGAIRRHCAKLELDVDEYSVRTTVIGAIQQSSMGLRTAVTQCAGVVDAVTKPVNARLDFAPSATLKQSLVNWNVSVQLMLSVAQRLCAFCDAVMNFETFIDRGPQSDGRFDAMDAAHIGMLQRLGENEEISEVASESIRELNAQASVHRASIKKGRVRVDELKMLKSAHVQELYSVYMNGTCMPLSKLHDDVTRLGLTWAREWDLLLKESDAFLESEYSEWRGDASHLGGVVNGALERVSSRMIAVDGCIDHDALTNMGTVVDQLKITMDRIDTLATTLMPYAKSIPPTSTTVIVDEVNQEAGGGVEVVDDGDKGLWQDVEEEEEEDEDESGEVELPSLSITSQHLSVPVHATEAQTGTYPVTLQRVMERLTGVDTSMFGDDERRSVTEVVNAAMRQARDPDNLCRMFEGWTPWI